MSRTTASKCKIQNSDASAAFAVSPPFCDLGTTSVHLKVGEIPVFVPKRHQVKHLDLKFHLVRDQGGRTGLPSWLK
jgi:hypothetical protein